MGLISLLLEERQCCKARCRLSAEETNRLVELHRGGVQLMPAASGSGLQAKVVLPAWRVLKPEAAVVG